MCMRCYICLQGEGRVQGGWGRANKQDIMHTVQTLYHRAKISFFALRGDCAHEKYLFILGVRD